MATSKTKDILIVDDDAFVLKFLRITLEKAGYKVRTAANGIEAIKIYEQEPTAVVITDIFMPEKDGLEILMEFKNLFQRASVIVISGGSTLGKFDFLKQAKAMGAKHTFAKPFDPRALVLAVESLMNKN